MRLYTSKEESGMTKTSPKSWTNAKLVKTATPSYCTGYQRAEQAAISAIGGSAINVGVTK